MIFIEVNGHTMQQYTEDEAFVAAGTQREDPEWERDMILNNWLYTRKWMLIEDTRADAYASAIQKAMDQGVTILIVKEKTDVQS